MSSLSKPVPPAEDAGHGSSPNDNNNSTTDVHLFDFVELFGLVSGSQHNGKRARVFEVKETSDGSIRMGVTVPTSFPPKSTGPWTPFRAGGATGLYVKPQNLKKLPNYYADGQFLRELVEHRFLVTYPDNQDKRRPHVVENTAQSPVVIRPVQGMGVGLFATRSYRPDQIVFMERPLLSFVGPRELRGMLLEPETLCTSPANLKRERNQLGSDLNARRRFLDGGRLPVDGPPPTSKSEPGEPLPCWAALTTLNKGFGDDPLDVRPLCALMNHSCAPTVVISPLGVITAMREVEIGDELTIAYFPDLLLKPRDERLRGNDMLREVEGGCLCPVCAQPDEKKREISEKRRAKLWEETRRFRQIREREAAAATGTGRGGGVMGGEVLKEAQRLKPMLEEEGLSMEVCFPIVSREVTKGPAS